MLLSINILLLVLCFWNTAYLPVGREKWNNGVTSNFLHPCLPTLLRRSGYAEAMLAGNIPFLPTANSQARFHHSILTQKVKY